MPTPPPPTLLLLLLLSFSLLHSSTSLHPDTLPLLSFKSSSSDPSKTLATWTNSTSPCSWAGVSCLQNRVYRLILQNQTLSGPLLSLTGLTHLRLLSLKLNRFSGPLPDLSPLTSLKLLFLSHNSLFGSLPPLPSNLYRLDLSHNFLTGSIPPYLNQLNHLITLRLESNQLTGSILSLNIPNLQDFNVSHNSLSGEIPRSLSSFPKSAFDQNPSLCSAPFEPCRILSSDPTRPGSNPNPSPIVSSTSVAAPPIKKVKKPMGTLAIVSIIVGDVFVLIAISVVIYLCFWNMRVRKTETIEGEKVVYSSSPYVAAQMERGKMVFFEGIGGRRFELEDLLKASAEMLGKGGSGAAYKAVMEDGEEVAVKRLKAGGGGGVGGGRREFEQQMEVVGRLRHENVVGLRAYYFARDEKLLVSDYMPNGSLFWLLHGNRGPGRTPLDWDTRLRIVAGAAKGLTFIHSSSCGHAKLTHGNIKSTNILIDKDGNARVSDFGLSMLMPPSSFSSKSNGYRAPESSDPRKITQKSDVYSFGVLLLELLTGKCPTMGDHVGSVIGYGGVVDLPRWVQSVVREEWTAEVFDLELMRYKDIEEEMVGLLQIAMACTSAAPDQRPKMNHVLKMIQEVREVEMSPSKDASDLVSDSPSVSEDASGFSQ